MNSKEDSIANYPLTSYQQDIWLKHELNPNSPLCNIGGAVEISGSFDYHRLNEAVNRAINSNDALRIRINEQDGMPFQVFMPELKYELPYIDASDRDDGKPFAEKWMQERFLEVFELDGLLFDFALIKADETLFFLFTKAHHIIVDGMGITQLNHEIVDYYNDGEKGLNGGIEKISFKDLIKKDEEYLKSTSYPKDVEYWLNEFAIIPGRLFNNNNKRVGSAKISSKRTQYFIKRSEYDRIVDLCSKNSCTELHYFVALVSLYLFRLYSKDEIVIDIPVLNRDKKERQIICHCTNAIPLKIKVSSSSTFIELLKDAKVRLARSYRHYKLSYGQIVRELKLKNESLSDITISFEVHDRKLNYVNTETHSTTLTHQHEQQTLNIQINPASANEDVVIYIDYLLEFFNYVLPIENVISHFKTIADDTLHNPEKKIKDIEILAAKEKHQLLVEWNDTTADYPRCKCVHQLFEEQVEKTPDNIAVAFGSKKFTYQELNKRANVVAHYLRESYNVKSGDMIGIQLDRSERMIISILGILKVGGAYVPIDPEYPEARIEYIIRNSLLRTIISDINKGVFIDINKILTIRCKDTNLETNIDTETPIYVIYTSGSTGEPKGTVIKHRNFVNYITWAKDFYFTDEYTGNFGLFTSISFDLTTTCIFLSLLRGKTLEVFNQKEGIDTILRHTFESASIDCVKLTPSHITLLGNLGIGKSLIKIAIVGGEQLLNDQVRILKSLNKDIKIVNEYGPTEATVGCIVKEIKSSEEQITIGKPIANTQIYLINNNALAPIGVPGEICIGGEGVAKEYLHKPELTKEKFIKNPFNNDPESRLYKTGDIARWLANGNIEYLGRIDEQVKINGNRVELGEIETTLNKLEGINSSAVVVNDDGSGKKRLIAYIVSSDELNIEAIRTSLSTSLLNYMIPALFVRLDALPLTPNGKIDKKTLQGLKNFIQPINEYIAPSTEIQKKLVKIWEDLFKREKIGISDNFFELGGDSILSIQIASRAKLVDVSFSPNDILKYQVIEELAKICTTQKSDTIADQGLIAGEINLTPIQSWFFENDFNNKDHYNQAVTLRVKKYIEPEILNNALNAIIQQHDVLRLKYKFENNKWHQYFKNDSAHNLEIINVADKETKDLSTAIEYYDSEIQTGLSITKGITFRSVLFQTTSNSDNYLLLVIHHLIVDGVSWRILIEDLKKACEQQTEGKTIDLGAKTSSFKQWSERLCNHVQSDTIAKELPFWTSTVGKYNIISLPLDKHAEENTVSSARNVNLNLSKELTKQLLQQTSRAYNTEINDLLLTALVLSVSNWTKQNSVSLHLEGHGREELFNDTYLSRTIGWFTSLFPVCLTIDHNTKIEHAIKSIKEQLRAIPRKGIGYGMLRYLSNSHEIPENLKMLDDRGICFNYLGQFNDLDEKDSSIISISNQSSGLSVCPTNKRTCAIDINLHVSNEQLVINWTYGENLHERKTIEALAENFTTQLERIIEHCIQPESKGFTPSDFPLCKISQEALDEYVLSGADLANIENIYPLSPMQEGMLFHTLYASGSDVYITQLTLDIVGELNIEYFKQAWQHIIDTHTILRTSFVYQGLQTPVQRVHKKISCDIEVIDHSSISDKNRKDKITQFLEEQRKKGFDLTIAPLSWITLIKTEKNNYTFIWTHHHILIDGWSMPIIFKELFKNYHALVSNQELTFNPDKYEEFIEYLSKRDKTEEERFWTAYLEGFTGSIEILVGNNYNNSTQELVNDKQKLALDASETDILKEFTKKHHITINTLVQGAWLTLLNRYSGNDDIIFGITVSGRPAELEGVEGKVGLFINTLPLRIKTRTSENVLEWLKEIYEQQSRVLEYQHTPLVEIQSLSSVPNNEPLFQSILIFENYPIEKLSENKDIKLDIANIRTYEKNNYPITIAVSVEERLIIDISYDDSLYSKDAIHRLLGHLSETFQNITQNTDKTISDIEILTPAEKHQQLVEWNDTTVEYPQDKTLIDLFEGQVEKTPDNIAVIFEQEKLTYRELNEKANQLGRYLQNKGVKPETLVGVYMERSLDMIVGLLGIMKAGGAYLPFDPAYPAERIAYMVHDSECQIILTQISLKESILENNKVNLICIDNDLVWMEIGKQPQINIINNIKPNNLVYVIYTSGSTGNPKGVMIEHGNLLNFLLAFQDKQIISQNDHLLALTTISFDIHALELYLPLVSGVCLSIVSKEVSATPELLVSAIATQKISIVQATPATWSMLMDSAWRPRQAITVLCGGETISETLKQRLTNNPRIKLYNLYGPTETTVWSTVTLLTQNHKVTIGKPISNTQIYILDKNNKLLPIGAIGELHIAGHGLARGYLKRDELTREKFIPNPYNRYSSARLYKTGDLARWLPDGNIEYLGRIDHQVKVRGFRIELGEIEAALSNIKEINNSVVIAKDNKSGNKHLVAYIVLANKEELNVEQIRKKLSITLPDYMVPSMYVKLDSIILTTSGKVNRKALPEPEGNLATTHEYIAPQTEIEKQLARIWQKVLKIEKVGIRDNFFELGGHSLLATQLVSEIKKELKIELTLKALFACPTIAKILKELQSQNTENISLPAIIINEEDRYASFPLTDVQQAYWVGRSNLYELGGVGTHAYVEIYLSELDVNRFSRVVNLMIDRHDMLRMVVTEDGQQSILEKVTSYEVPVLNLQDSTPTQEQQRFLALRNELSHQFFSGHQWPLFDIRITIFRDGTYKIHYSMDSLLLDASSSLIFFNELVALYFDANAQLPKPRLSFRDYVITEQSLRESRLYKQSQQYWMERIHTIPRAPELPLAKLPGVIKDVKFSKQRMVLSSSRWEKLKEKTNFTGVTPTVFIIQCFAEVMNRWSKANHFTLNLTLFNRIPFHEDVNKVLGDFTSLTLLEMDYRQIKDFNSRLKDTQYQLWNDLDNRYFSGVQVQRELSKVSGETVTMPVVVTSTLGIEGNKDRDGWQITSEGSSDIQKPYSISQTPQVWIDCQISERSGELQIDWDSVKELFPIGMLEDMFIAFEGLFIKLSEDDKLWSANHIELLPTYQQTLLSEVNATPKSFPDKMLHELFVEQVEIRGAKTAIVTREKTISYKELYHISSQIGRELQQNGVRPNELVAIVMHKGWEQIAAAMGILFAGAVYMPIDASLPQTRIERLLDIGEIKQVVSLTNVLNQLQIKKQYNWLLLDQVTLNNQNHVTFNKVQTPTDLAYTIFTSGSTGEPKGVMIDHRGAVNTILDINQRFEITEEDSCLAISSMSFDLSVYDVFGMLAIGGTIVIPQQEEQKEPSSWISYIHKYKITIWNTVPALMQMLVEYAHDNQETLPLTKVLLSGDWIPVSLPGKIKQLCQNALVISLGGATEASIWSIYYPIATVEPNWKSIPYGKPLANQSFYVFKPCLTPCPLYTPGDLYIGGVGLAQGYWNDKKKTDNSFTIHPITKERLYKTGDLGRYLPDGNIEFLGREDAQVKIQGHRIELGEIEHALKNHEWIENAIVDARNIGGNAKKLVAYIVPKQNSELLSQEELLKQFLSTVLPEYMIPSYYCFIGSIPLTPNGKVDRKALPEPEVNLSVTKEYIAPRTDQEKQLAQIWQQVLGVEKVGIHDDFFELGGHSLLATQVISKIRNTFNNELPLRTLFENSTINSFAKQIDKSKQKEGHLSKIPVCSRDKDLPLSFAQERLWFIDQYSHDNTYNILAAIQLKGNLNVTILKKAILEIIHRHEVLRTNFVTINGIPKLVIHDQTKFSLEKIDFSHLSKEELGKQIRLSIEQESRKIFDLGKDILIRIALYTISDQEHVLFMNKHHIITDGWSLSILINEITALYQSFLQNKPSFLLPLPIQYADFSVWQREYLQGEVMEQQASYWKKKLKDIPVLELPTDKVRPNKRTFNGNNISFALNNETAQKFKQLGKEQNITLFMNLLSALNILLHKYSSQEDICVGSPIANRTRNEVEGLIGFFVNTLVLRTDLADEISFSELLNKVKTNTLEAYENQEMPFEKVVEIAQIERDLSRSPLFQVMLIIQNNPQSKLVFSGITLEHISLEQTVSKFDLTFDFTETDEGILGGIEYNTDLFYPETIGRMIGHFNRIIETCIANPYVQIKNIEILTHAEKQQILVDWNKTEVDYPKDKTLIDLFEKQVEKTPSNIAVVFENNQLTYKQLNERSNQLAHHLQSKEVKPDSLVGICVERSLEMIVGLLGIIKAGGAYVPIDPNYPHERIVYMLEDADCKIVLTQKYIELPEVNSEIICLDSDWNRIENQPAKNVKSEVKNNNLVYVIYTSGSTGKPKGVMNQHKGVVNRLLWTQDNFRLHESDVILQKTTYSFDVSVWELFWPIIIGCKLVFAKPEGHKDNIYLIEKIVKEKITTIHFVPSMLHTIIDTEGIENCMSLKRVLCSGEALPYKLTEQFYKKMDNCSLHNLYGPTEAAVDVSYFPCLDYEKYLTIPIGKPVSNTKLYILDKNSKIIPIGVSGELHIGGEQVARGYLKKPELTAEKFINNPFSDDPDSKLYKTGDLVRYLPDGNIEFLGRIDEQVKIRGFRIELGEIETTLNKNEEIATSVVLVKEDKAGNKHLVAYVVPSQEKEKNPILSIEKLRKELSNALPYYMIPSFFIKVESIPLTPNGKVNKKALPALEGNYITSSAYVEANTDLEKKLSEIWKEVLGIERVGVNISFFELGGNSLLIVKLAGKINQCLNKEIPIPIYFTHTTIKSFIENIVQINEKQIRFSEEENITYDLRRSKIDKLKNRKKQT